MSNALSVVSGQWSEVSGPWSVVCGLWSAVRGPFLLHPHQMSIADQVLLQVRVERALASQPGKGSFGFLTQMNLRSLDLAFLGWPGAFDFDFDQVGARRACGPGLRVQTTGGDQLGLGQLVGGEDLQDGTEVLVGEVVGGSAEQPADVTLGQAGRLGQVALVEVALLGLALEGDAEITHAGET